MEKSKCCNADIINEWDHSTIVGKRCSACHTATEAMIEETNDREKRRSKYWNTMVDILEGQFPKGECKERGKALVMLSYIEMMLNGVEFNDEGEPNEK